MKKLLKNIFNIYQDNTKYKIVILGFKITIKSQALMLNLLLKENELNKIKIKNIENNYKQLEKLITENNNSINLLSEFIDAKLLPHVEYFKSEIIDLGKDNQFIVEDESGNQIINTPLEGMRVIFYGNNNKIVVKLPQSMKNCIIKCSDNNIVKIDKSIYSIKNLHIAPIYPMSNSSEVYIGKNFVSTNCKIFNHDEISQKLYIGDNVMTSFDVVIWPSDGHSVINKETNAIENQISFPTRIGNHVWLERGVSVLKNTIIPDNTILATNTLANKVYEEKNTILAGIPAKIVKHNMDWDMLNTSQLKNGNEE